MTIAKKELTDLACRKAKAPPAGGRKIVWDALVPGFGLRVTERGKKTFVLVKRFAGAKQPSPRAIAEYGAITLEAARATAQRWNELLKAGKDPVAEDARRREHEARQEKEAEEAKRRAVEDSFDAVFDLFMRHHLSKRRTGTEVARNMRRELFSSWGGRPLSSIGRRDIITVISAIHDAGHPIAANRLLAAIKRFFRFAVDRGVIDASPAALVRKPGDETKRDRVLAPSEIRALWTACDQMGAFGQAVRLMLVTGQRLNEVSAMTWAEVDRDHTMWTLARERTKGDREHRLPLSRLALSILDAMPENGPFVFSTTAKGPLKGWSKAKAKLDKLMGDELGANASLPEWHLHDLRRTAATNMARLGVDRIVIGKVLNHAETAVTSVYDRYTRAPEMQFALNTWGAELERLVDPRPAADTVVHMTPGRRR